MLLTAIFMLLTENNINALLILTQCDKAVLRQGPAVQLHRGPKVPRVFAARRGPNTLGSLIESFIKKCVKGVHFLKFSKELGRI